MPYGGFSCPVYISWGPKPYEFPPVNVATDTCGEIDSTIAPFLDCSLCGLGWPQATGIIDFRLHRDPPCGNNSSGILGDFSYWHNGASLPGSFQLECANPGDDAEPNANQWVVNKNYYWGSLYKMYCSVTVDTPISVTVTGTIYWLSNIDKQWKAWISFSQSVNEYNPSGNTDPRRPRSFISPKIPVAPNGMYGGAGDITDIKFALATYPQIEGCGKELCSMFNGQYYSTCFRAEITDPGVPPQIRQIGKNTIPCGTQDPYGSWYTDCECDQIILRSNGQHETVANARPGYAADYGFIGVGDPTVDIYPSAYNVVQQIQGTGNLIVKKIGNGPMFIATKQLDTSPWSIVIPTVVQGTSPTIHQAIFGDPAWRTVKLYSLSFPNNQIVPDSCANAIQPIPEQPSGGWWWCGLNATCVNSPVAPYGYTNGPFNSIEDCQASCGVISPIQWWCIANQLCFQSVTEPVDATGGPFATEDLCKASCPEPPPSEGFMATNPADSVVKPNDAQLDLLKRFKLPCVNRGPRLNNGTGFS